MLPLIVLLSFGLVQEGDQKPTESDIRSAHQMLAGEWRVVSATDNGDPIGPEIFRRKIVRDGKLTVSPRVITHITPETGETRTTGYMINPGKFPREIDLITPEERLLRGIYKFEDDNLVVCYATREGTPRPTEFESKPGSFRLLLRLRVGGKAADAAQEVDSVSPPTATPRTVKTRTASLSSPVAANVERKPTPGELDRERALLGGNWEILSITDDGERLAASLIRAKMAEDGRVRIGVRGVSIVTPRDETKRLWAYRLDPVPTPKHIDLTTQFDTVLKGIYTFEGDRLLICVAKNDEDPRPREFDAKEGSNRILYTMKMVHDEPAPAPVVTPTPAPAPPKPTAEELARRREQQIRDMLVGSWSMTDAKGNFVAVFRQDGTFSSTRTLSKRKLFEPDMTTSNGTWTYGGGVINARITGTTDRNMLGYGFHGRLQSIGDSSMVTADNTGKLLTLTKLR